MLRAGHLLLANGAETWRVEETIRRLGCDLGAERIETYPTPTGIIVSSMAPREHRTRIVRATELGIHLGRVAAIVNLTRRADAGELTRDVARDELERIARMPRGSPSDSRD